MSLQSLVAAFASVGLSSNDSNDDVVTVTVMEAVLEQLYGLQHWQPSNGASHAQQHTNNMTEKELSGSSKYTSDVPKHEICKAVRVEMIINLLLNLFDQ